MSLNYTKLVNLLDLIAAVFPVAFVSCYDGKTWEGQRGMDLSEQHGRKGIRYFKRTCQLGCN